MFEEGCILMQGLVSGRVTTCCTYLKCFQLCAEVIQEVLVGHNYVFDFSKSSFFSLQASAGEDFTETGGGVTTNLSN